MRFPITDLLSEEECYRYLKRQLHPDGLSCPNGHELPSDQAPHDRRRAPVLAYRCRECERVFNIFTDTVWKKTHYSPSEIVMVLRGIAKGVSTSALAEELGRDYSTLLERRHRIQQAIREGKSVGIPGERGSERDSESSEEGSEPGSSGKRGRSGSSEEKLFDGVLEVDEMYQNAGEKSR